MGIKGLMKLIQDKAPRAVREQEIKNLFGRKVAVDASMSLYQFLIAVRSGPGGDLLTNENGEVTSHLQGMLYRTIRLMENGVKPAYVFDGTPPQLKKGELDKRKAAKAKAEAAITEAKEGDASVEDVARLERRTVRVTREQNEDAKRLLRLMGVPVVEAPGEAEAMCAALCKAGKVYATATEDMDALTFGTPRLCRNLTFSAARKMPVVEIDLAKVLEGMEMTMDQFIDLCVLMGCDYTGTVRGVGPVRAFKLIKEFGSTAPALASLDPEKHPGIADVLHAEAAVLFKSPDVADPETVPLEWGTPDEDGIVKFLCDEKGFNEERIRSSIKRLVKAKDKGAQRRMDSFFGAKPSSSSSSKGKGGKDKGKKGLAGSKRKGASPSSSSKRAKK